MSRLNFLFLVLIFSGMFSLLYAETKINTENKEYLITYRTLSPTSITQHIAFYRLYPNTKEGQDALNKAIELLGGTKGNEKMFSLANIKKLAALPSLITPEPELDTKDISNDTAKLIKKFGDQLTNRKLKGCCALSEKEVLQLPYQKIDLVRGLLLSILEDDKDKMETICKYEATIDFMALQIRAELPSNPTSEEKINAINKFIFEDMRFRFPPFSLSSEKIDEYTLLPSVIDSRRGVCLGVSILYLAIAQRLNLPLEIVTPPGHIYLRYKENDKTINIETTARGINLQSEQYLGVNTRKLQLRNIKEVIGLAHFNQASIFLKNDEYKKAIQSYEKAEKYLPQDKLLKEFLGYQYIFAGQQKKGVELLKPLRNYIPDYAVSKESIIDDFLDGNVDTEGIKAVFMRVDETKKSIEKKQKAIQNVLVKYPKFRAGLFHLAITWMQLYRRKEAIDALVKYHKLNNNNADVEYYLSVFYLMRHNFAQSWKHLKQVEKITTARNFNPKPLKKLRLDLSIFSPE